MADTFPQEPVKVSDIMQQSASLLNDALRHYFTDDVLLPYFQIAYDEIIELLIDNNHPVTNHTSAVIVVPAKAISIGGGLINDNVKSPPLPIDLIEPRQVYERDKGTNQDFILMTRVEILPKYTTMNNSLIYWAWERNIIKFLGATTDKDVSIDYIGNSFPPIVSASNTIQILSSKTALAYRTAAIAAEYIGENPDRAASLNAFAIGAIERMINNSIKTRQTIATRHRPFMSSYKTRSAW